jgi:hypothetical protein
VGGVVDSHVAGAALGLDRFHLRELCGGVFVRDGESAITARGKRVTRDRIEPVCVHTPTDRNGAEDFPEIAVHESHEFVVAAHNENFVGGVYRAARGRFAGRQRRGLFDFAIAPTSQPQTSAVSIIWSENEDPLLVLLFRF